LRQIRYLCLLLALVLCLSGCGGASGTEAAPVGSIGDDSVPNAGYSTSAARFEPYQAPAFADSAFHRDLAEADGDAMIDVSAVSDGYVGVSAQSDTRLKFQVVKDETVYNYDLASDGTPSIFPLQSGDGTYRFRIMENVTESRYAERFAVSCDVALKDEFTPFIRPSDYADYSQSSLCVKKAAELAGTVSDEVGVVSEVYAYICRTVTYDTPKAENVQSGYLPDVDETMTSGKGICIDYAALAAAMLRSQGIPTKVIFGYVSPNDLYHAWNMFYTRQTGWVTVSFETKGGQWTRMDLTFVANGADDSFVGNGENYTDLYYY
jgi:hypothetical protein